MLFVLISEYVHFTTPPVLSSNKYKTLMVSINFKKYNLAGFGQAMFYQLQYKVSNEAVLYYLEGQDCYSLGTSLG